MWKVIQQVHRRPCPPARVAGLRLIGKAAFVFVFLAFPSTAYAWADSSPPLRNPVLLNIGFVCQWDLRCMNGQERARQRALGFVRKFRPPDWKVQLCNRNASRRRNRVDWVGFNNCIRNKKLSQRPKSRRVGR